MEEEIHFIRNYINMPNVQYALLEDHAPWLQICSSIDVIEDTSLAIESYTSFSALKDGEQYLATYGLLQALFLQQDAVRNLCEALNLPITLNNYPRILEIREIRNDSVGHPTKRNRRKSQPTSHHFISRITLSNIGFTLISNYSDGNTEIRYININALINDQKQYILEMLIAATKYLKIKEKDHKEKHNMDKLEDIFPATMNYYFEKVYEGINRDDYKAFAHANLKSIRSIIEKFKNKIEERAGSLDAYDSVKYTYDLIDYPLYELEGFYENRDGCISRKTAYIFNYFVKEHVQELVQMAREIDDDYETTS